MKTDCRALESTDEVDHDCDIPAIHRLDDDTDLESFEQEERRLEEEAARVSVVCSWVTKSPRMDSLGLSGTCDYFQFLFANQFYCKTCSLWI